MITVSCRVYDTLIPYTRHDHVVLNTVNKERARKIPKFQNIYYQHLYLRLLLLANKRNITAKEHKSSFI